MTQQEIQEVEDGLRYEEEKNRRLAHIRRQRLADNAELVQNIVLILLGLIAGAIILYLYVTQEKRERAAYLEGYYGVSHAVAMQMAEKEVR